MHTRRSLSERLAFAAAAASAAALLLGAQSRSTFAGEFVPVDLRGTVTIESTIPIGDDGSVLTVEVTARDVGRGTYFGRYTSVLRLVVDIDLGTGLPLRGGGTVVQTNADGSTVTWLNHFEGIETRSTIIGGNGRFENAEGRVEGVSILNPDGTFSYDEAGWITSIGSNRRASP